MAVMLIVAALASVPVESLQSEAYALVRDEVLVAVFGARPGFGDGPDDQRFRIDNHWPVRK